MKTFSMIDVGRKRNTNQDYAFVSDQPIGNLPNLLVIADGMGGHKAGDFASRHAVESLVDAIKASEENSPEAMFQEAIQFANQKLIEASKQDKSLEGMGTTMVVATVMENTLYFANIGDSRMYLLNKSIKQLSKDHSFVQEMVRLGGINAEDAKNHPDRNLITRAVGVCEKVELDFFEYRLKKRDIILMCTDGLSGMVDDEEIYRVVKSSRDVVEAVEKLVEKANENGGNDNIGIILAEPFAGEVKV